MHRIGVIGNGFVGKATGALRNSHVEVIAYDKDPAACDPLGTTLEEVARCDVVVISVPTPMNASTGEVHLRIVEDVVLSLRQLDSTALVVVRSTVPPGTCDRLGVYFMPEFLTEANSVDDFRNSPRWIFGVPRGGASASAAAAETLESVLRRCRDAGCIRSCEAVWMPAAEAEMVKYFRNTYLATKVAYCNEISTLCGALGLDYDNVRRMAASDPRIGLSHTSVPGPDGKNGFGGTCFPKDCHGLMHLYHTTNVPCPVLGAAVERNENIDRAGQDWRDSVGRAVTSDSSSSR